MNRRISKTLRNIARVTVIQQQSTGVKQIPPLVEKVYKRLKTDYKKNKRTAL